MASLSLKLPVQVFRGLPRLGSFSAVQRVRDIEGPPWLGSYSIDQWVRHFKGLRAWDPTLKFVHHVRWASLSTFQLPMLACEEREAVVMAPPPCVTQQHRLFSMAAWLSSTGNSHHDLLPHIPLIHLSAALALGLFHSLNSSSQLCAFRDTSGPVQGMYGSNKGCLMLIPFRPPQISCFTLSLKFFSSDQKIALMWGSDPCFSSPSLLRAGPGQLTLVFPPSSFLLPSFVWVYIFFLLVRNSCPLSGGVLHALLGLMVYS